MAAKKRPDFEIGPFYFPESTFIQKIVRKDFTITKRKKNSRPEYDLYAGFDPVPPFDWPELRRIMEANVPQLRKMTFWTIPELIDFAKRKPKTPRPAIRVGRLVLMPFINPQGFRSVMFQLLEERLPSSSVSEGQNRFAPNLWRPK